jgi:peptide methionine sulfoxide reductase msrA/msrB
MAKTDYQKPHDDELRERLTPLQYQVTQRDATEPPFHNAYWDHHAAGLYVDVATGEPLFSSRDKFDSGTGWPSFTRPVDPERVVERSDGSHGMVRVEVRSRDGGSHLGHLFDDGPFPTGMRYCINSAALRFIPVERLAAEGYGDYLPLFAAGGAPGSTEPAIAAPGTPVSCAVPRAGSPAGCSATLETAILAGGCFWGMEEILRSIPGVIETEVGYTGGQTARPTYHDVKAGRTGHTEAVRVVFDPVQLSYAELLESWFFRMHDPTTLNRQGNDAGTQYRSAIFVTSPEQRKVAMEVKERVDRSGKWRRPVVTEIVEAGPFTRAEEYHQKYLVQNPGGSSCHFLRD